MKKSRKKMLLSSIAMLLVALVALGTATFAWYANVQTVTAQATNFKASVSDGLTIRHRNDAFDATSELYQTGDKTWTTALNATNNNALLAAPTNGLAPAAISDSDYSTTVGATGQSADPDSPTLSNGLSGIELTNRTYFLVDEFYVATESSAPKAATLKFTATGDAISNKSYLNIAIYVDDTLKGIWTTHTGKDSTSMVSYTAAQGANPATYTTGSSKNVTALTAGNQVTVDTNVSCKTKTAGGAHVQIIAYADGFDSNCYTNNVNINALNVEYSVTAN